MIEAPSNGDVLITSDCGLHFISVVPHPHRLSFANLSSALDLASRWAAANNGNVWRSFNGTVIKLSVNDLKWTS